MTFSLALVAALGARGEGAPCAVASDAGSVTLSGRAWFQTFWEPCKPCCNRTRVGRRGDGGKWVCLDVPLTAHSRVISVGSNNEFSFELDLLQTFRVAPVRVYDHTSQPSSDANIQFYQKKMTPYRLSSVLRALEHEHQPLSVLKVDCEGCELALLTPAILSKLHAMGTQLLLEVHWSELGQSGIVSLWRALAAAGYGPFHKEPNIEHSDGSCVEYAFI